MNILIIEDEVAARAKLIHMINKLRPDATIVGELESVTDALKWLSSNEPPDLAFVDIRLSDNNSFEIFRQHNIDFPVVFTTAYDQYILESFEYNSIDYLLKPIGEEKLERSLSKVSKLKQHFLQRIQRSTAINDRIVVRKGTEYIVLPTNEIAYFFTEHKIVFVKDLNSRKMIIDKTLGELEQFLDSGNFFRLNRKYIVRRAAIEKFKPDNGKIQVFLTPASTEEIHVSKESAPAFRAWIGKQ